MRRGHRDDDVIVTTFVIVDKLLAALRHRDDVRAGASDAAVLTVAVVAAKAFQHHLARALRIMHLGRSLSGPPSAARFSRRRHALRGWPGPALEALGAVCAHGDIFLLDSMPVPVCRRARGSPCREVRGRDFRGYGAAKKERFFGRRPHRSCITRGVPVAFDLPPGGPHDRTPIHALTHGLPAGAAVSADKADHAGGDAATILADTGVRPVPSRQANRAPNQGADKRALRGSRKRIETLYSQLEALGVPRLRACTDHGRERKRHASRLAATIANADQQSRSLKLRLTYKYIICIITANGGYGGDCGSGTRSREQGPPAHRELWCPRRGPRRAPRHRCRAARTQRSWHDHHGAGMPTTLPAPNGQERPRPQARRRTRGRRRPARHLPHRPYTNVETVAHSVMVSCESSVAPCHANNGC